MFHCEKLTWPLKRSISEGTFFLGGFSREVLTNWYDGRLGVESGEGVGGCNLILSKKIWKKKLNTYFQCLFKKKI